MTTDISASKKHLPHRMHKNSLANLKPYKPGQNGNPKPGNSLKAALLNALGEPLKEPGENATARERVIYATLKGAIDCEPTSAHLKEVWDRTEGKVQEPDKPQYNDNRQYNFIVLGDENKQKLQQLLSGEKPKTIEATR